MRYCLLMTEVLNRPTLAEIRKRLGNIKAGIPQGSIASGIAQGLAQEIERREFLSCKSIATGVPCGVICEITGTARTAWILDLLVQNPALSTFWAEDQLTILPTALHQRCVDLSRILLAETGDKLFQTLRKALRSKLFNCIVLPGIIEEIKLLKALQLFAREAHASVFFLSKNPKNAWAIPFQICVDWNVDGKSYRVEILKSKFGHAGQAKQESTNKV